MSIIIVIFVKCIPVRRGFEVVLKINWDVKLFLQDATARAVPRPLDYEVQKEFYSGKKLSQQHKDYNYQLSKPLVRIEHVMKGIKRLRIITE